MDFTKYSIKSYQGHRKKVLDMGWNSSGDKLISGSADGTIRVWNLDNYGLEKDQEYKSHKDQVQWHPDDHHVFVSASCDKTIKIFDIRTPKDIKSTDTKGYNINLAWRPDGNQFAVGNKDDKIYFYDYRMMNDLNKEVKNIFIDFKCEINEISWDKSGSVLFLTSGIEANKVYFQNKSTNSGPILVLDGQNPSVNPLEMLQCHQGTSYCIAVSNNNTYFATAGSDAMIALWDLQEMIQEQVRKLCFSYNDEYLATASEDLMIVGFLFQGTKAFDIECQAAQNSVAWHPKQNILAFAGEKTSSDDGQVKLFLP